MTQNIYLMLYYMLTMLLLSPMVISSSSSFSRGLSFQLIYSDHPSNLTSIQRLQRFLHLSESRIRQLESQISLAKFNTTTIRPPIALMGSLYNIVVSIGTGSGLQSYYLELDTGSQVTWTQCIHCKPCFPQNSPFFDPTKSPSIRYLAPTDRLCAPPYQRSADRCTYMIHYADQNWVNGVFYRDTFSFQGTRGGFESINGLVFGCTYSSHMNWHGEPAGIMGMDNSPLSFATQLAARTGGRFSYCLFHPGSAEGGYLRFGNDIRMPSRAKRTSILRVPGITHYFLQLDDLSLNNRRFRFPSGTFHQAIIDSGSTVTYLIQPVYNRVRATLVETFQHYHLHPVDGRHYSVSLDLCYQMPHNFARSLPTMTFHFAGSQADLVVKAEEVFAVDEARGFFCFAMLPSNDMTVLGVFQQFNTRFTYDLANQKLYFNAEDCTQDRHH